LQDGSFRLVQAASHGFEDDPVHFFDPSAAVYQLSTRRTVIVTLEVSPPGRDVFGYASGTSPECIPALC